MALVILTQVGLIAFLLMLAIDVVTKRAGSDTTATFGGICLLGLCGYLFFWIAFFDVELSRYLQVGFLIACAALAIARFRTRLPERAALEAFGVLFVSAIIILVWTFFAAGPVDPLVAGSTRWITYFANDNALPLNLAQALDEKIIRSPFIGDWQSSDRPPLQTGMYMLLRLPWDQPLLVYQTVGVCLQCLVIPATYAFARAVGLNRSLSLMAAAAFLVSPLALLNTAYVWPKLLSASFGLGLLAVWFSGAPYQKVEAAIVMATAASLSFLSHGTSVFFLLGAALTGLALRRFPTRTQALTMTAIVACLVIPWIIYQNVFDPPGNALLKMHLAGVIYRNEASLVSSLAQAYASISFEEWLKVRWINLVTIVGNPIERAGEFINAATSINLVDLRTYRVGDLFYVSSGIGMFSLAVLALPAGLLKAEFRAPVLAIMITFALWIMLSILPMGTVAFQGSMAPQPAIVVLSVLALSRIRVAGWPETTTWTIPLAVFLLQLLVTLCIYAR